MPKIDSLARQLIVDHPQFSFTVDTLDRWTPETKTIHYNPNSQHAMEHLLHELAHAILHHQAFQLDITLLTMERDAWVYAQSTLSTRYSIQISDDLIQDSLDTYRDWIHQRSTCPKCQQTGYQSSTQLYMCPNCQQTWRVSHNSQSHIRRYQQHTP